MNHEKKNKQGAKLVSCEMLNGIGIRHVLTDLVLCFLGRWSELWCLGHGGRQSEPIQQFQYCSVDSDLSKYFYGKYNKHSLLSIENRKKGDF